MKQLMRFVAMMLVMALPQMVAAQVISGDITGGGTVSGTVTSSNAWVASNATDGEAVNFWTFTANSGDTLSAYVTSSSIEFGVSVYSGVVDQMDLLFEGFNNAGDFGGNIYIGGTNPVTGAIGTSLSLLLPFSGVYTIAVGGEHGLAYDGNFAYDMNVNVAPVPLPAAVWFFMSGLLGLGALRGKRSR